MRTRRTAREAWLDLAALVLIWAGTGAITLVGVPILFSDPIQAENGGIVLAESGSPLLAEADPHTISARRHYWFWAVPGFSLITAGMVRQAVTPLQTLARHRRHGARAGVG